MADSTGGCNSLPDSARRQSAEQIRKTFSSSPEHSVREDRPRASLSGVERTVRQHCRDGLIEAWDPLARSAAPRSANRRTPPAPSLDTPLPPLSSPISPPPLSPS